MDRISSLPDHILCHILSFLPTKYAVASSILATRWKYLWTSVPVFDFDDRLHGHFCSILSINGNCRSEITFHNFVSRVMLLHVLHCVRKFRLIYECHYIYAPFRTWFFVAISRNLQELELDFSLSHHDGPFELPRNFFSSNPLVVMKLSRMPLDVPSVVYFPRLKILELRRIMYSNENCIQNLLSGCQVLEELVIEEIAREQPKVVHISIYTLRSLSFSYRFVIDGMMDYPYKFIIDAPKLEYFHVKGQISDVFEVNNLAALISVHLDLRQTAVPAEIFSTCHQRFCNFLKGVADVQTLTLSNDIVQLLCPADDQELPKLCNLKQLALGIGFEFCWKRLLIELMKCSPFLELPILNNKLGIWRNVDEVMAALLKDVPEYLLSHIKGMLIKELYTNFKPESLDHLVKDVELLKRLLINCRCPIMLSSQLGLL